MGTHHHHGTGTGGGTVDIDPRTRILLLALVIPLVIGAAVGVVLLWPDGGQAGAATGEDARGGAYSSRVTVTLDEERHPGRVLDVTAETCPGAPEDRLPDGSVPDTVLCPEAQVELLAGPDTGAVVTVPVTAQEYRAGLDPGTRVVLARFPADPLSETTQDTPSGSAYGYVDYDRSRALTVLAVLFAVLVVAVGRLRGLAALAGLAGTYAAIAFFILPALREGRPALWVAVCASVLIMTVVLYLAHGVSTRTTTALLGTIVGLGVAAALGSWASDAAHLTGLVDEDSYALSNLTGGRDLSGIILAGLILAGLGVLNDVTISQVSAVWEIRAVAPDVGFRRLFGSGMRVGRDHLASSVYTIAFAYAGAALPGLLLIDLYDQPLAQVLTAPAIAEEIARTVVGAAGFIVAVPVTTAVAAAAVARSRPSPPTAPVVTDAGFRPPWDGSGHVPAPEQLPGARHGTREDRRGRHGQHGDVAGGVGE